MKDNILTKKQWDILQEVADAYNDIAEKAGAESELEFSGGEVLLDAHGKPWKDAHGNPQYAQVLYGLQVTADITKDECYEQPIPTDFKTKKEFLDWFHQERWEHAEAYDVGEEIQYYTPGENGCPDIDTLKDELDTIKEVYEKSVAVVEAIQNSRDMDVASQKVGKKWHGDQRDKAVQQVTGILELLHGQGFKPQETKKILKEAMKQAYSELQDGRK